MTVDDFQTYEALLTGSRTAAAVLGVGLVIAGSGVKTFLGRTPTLWPPLPKSGEWYRAWRRSLWMCLVVFCFDFILFSGIWQTEAVFKKICLGLAPIFLIFGSLDYKRSSLAAMPQLIVSVLAFAAWLLVPELAR